MLEICKASAGSGKTHHLAGKYMEMLLCSGSPDKYKSIMAVTFTNKATAEMKKRIIKELYRLSVRPSESDFYQDFKENSDIKKAAARSQAPDIERYISDKAGKYLSAILNDYTAFGVSTIDRFLQQIMRAFAREIGQYPSYNVELDDAAVLQFAVDNLMNSLEDNKPVLDWLIKLSVEAIKEGRDWNTVPRLLKLGNELFTEDYKLAMADVGENNISRKNVEAYKDELTQVVQSYRKNISDLRKEAMDILGKYNLAADNFKGGSRSFMTYVTDKINDDVKVIPQWSESFKAAASAKNPEEWYSKTCKVKDQIENAFNDGLIGILANIADENSFKKYMTANAILANVNEMGVLGDILQEIKKYCREENILLLSETTAFLSRIIKDSFTPFIYEKVGVRIENYLLDEFQDTSRLQWNNFRPLIAESLSNGNISLVVGDVKQSIYRWRGSDWNILYKEVKDDFPKFEKIDHNLESNWRSSVNVIKFNNNVFSKMPGTLLKNGDEDMYSGCVQTLPEKAGRKNGHVKVEFFDMADKAACTEKINAKIIGTLKELISRGYNPGDISFLVRTNKEGEAIAELLLSNGYNVMTEESLGIQSSSAVRHIVNILKLMDNPDDNIIKYIGEESGRVEEAINVGRQEISLYNICENIIRSMDEKERSAVPFLQAFMDTVTEFTSKEGSNIHKFLQWWDESASRRSVSAAAGKNSVRITTIHKSKGLEFDVVIIPFLDGKFSMNKLDSEKMLWVKTNRPEDEIQVVPLQCSSSSLRGTKFEEQYEREKRYKIVDSLNLAYVAFTRAKDELIIFAGTKEEKDGKHKDNSIANCLYNNLEDNLKKDDGNEVYELGDWTEKEEDDEESGETVVPGDFVSLPIGERLQLTLRGGDFFEDGRSEDNARKRGIVLHDILSRTALESDLKDAVDESVADGTLSRDDRDGVFSLLSGMLENVRERHWFDGSYELLNEVTILTPGNDVYRPDRIMIKGKEAIVVDYKFGKEHNGIYGRQIGNYINLLSRMGYVNVKGYLWYSDRIVEF